MMEPITVTAETPSGFIAADAWSPSLDGILAWAAIRERDGMEKMNTAPFEDLSPVDWLPIEKQRDGDIWWYSSSMPMYDVACRTIRHIHRRFDRAHGETVLPSKFKKLTLATGAYKDRRIARELITTKCVTWHLIANPAEVDRLLSSVFAIGRDVARGAGEVSKWTVQTGGNAQWAQDLRPLPAHVAAERGIQGPVMLWGVAPPARITSTECVMPFQGIS